MGDVGVSPATLLFLFSLFIQFYAAFHSFMELSHSLKFSLLFVGYAEMQM